MTTAVVFTGKGYVGGGPTNSGFSQPQTLRTRSVWEDMARSMQWVVQKGVSCGTDYLVSPTGSGGRQTKKIRDAQDFGAHIITYKEFQRMYDRAVQVAASAAFDPPPTIEDIADKHGGLQVAAAEDPADEEIPGWGMF